MKGINPADIKFKNWKSDLNKKYLYNCFARKMKGKGDPTHEKFKKSMKILNRK